MKHGKTTDVKAGVQADYKLYRKIHFSKAKCPRECPYCARARQARVQSEGLDVVEARRRDSEMTYDDLPTVMEYLKQRRGKKRSRAARKALAEFWLHGEGNDVPYSMIGKAEDAMDRIGSDMAAEWEADGYSDKEIAQLEFDVAYDQHPRLRPAIWWLDLLYKVPRSPGPTWKLMPERF